MRVLGVDPGISSIAWAIYDDRSERIGTIPDPPDIIVWGDEVNWPGRAWQIHLGRYDCVAIEWPVIFPGAGNEVRDTIATAGLWWGRFGKGTLLIPRATVASALHVKGDARINAVMAKLCPALAEVRKGLNGHHRAAAACALVAAGRIPR